MKQKSQKLNSVEKALQLLLMFTTDHPSWGVRDLSARLGFSPATVQRILKTLKAYAFIGQDSATQQYRLGNVYFQFLDTIQSTFPITRAALVRSARGSGKTSPCRWLNLRTRSRVNSRCWT